MKIKLKIQQKIQFFIISASILIYIVAVGYISFNARKMAYNDAIEITHRHVNESAVNIQNILDKDMALVKTLAEAFIVYNDLPLEDWKILVTKMYGELFKNRPHIYSLWDSWELSVVEPNWDKPYGRFRIVYWRENGTILHEEDMRSLDGDPVLYGEIKKRRIPSIWEPYEDVFTNNKSEKFLMTSLNAPILVNGGYVGIVAVDITLDGLQQMIEDVKPFEGSYAFLISNGGLIAAHPNKELLVQNIGDIFTEDNKNHKISREISKGKDFSYLTKDENGDDIYVSYAPINVAGTGTPWSIAISVPVDTVMAKANRNFRISLLVGIAGILLLAFVISLISKNITNPLVKITDLLKRLSKGYIDEKMRVKIQSGDEIEEMSDALNSSINGLNKKVDFANHIEKGELNYEFDLLSDDDILGKSLIDMRNSLVKAKEEDDKRKIEDEKRRWANEGLAKFADILRQNNNNLEKLATEIIMNLVNYLKANQGGLFILNDENSDNIHFNLLSAYAFDRRKFKQKHIKLGEGLVGTCAIEKKTIYITEIPQNYIEITSGLGGSNPNCLLIVPLKLEEDVLGIIEIASFNLLEKHEIEFVEKIAESIASTLSSVRINIRTSELLERSQQQAEEMAAQEEEMRQNMEELQATQEESSRKSIEMEGLVEALNTSSYVLEYDLDGYIKSVNSNYLTLLGLTGEEVIGTHHAGNMEFSEKQKADYEMFWKELKNGKIQKETTKIKIKNKEFVFAETYTPIKNTEGDIYKVLKISNNITDFQKNTI